MPKRLGLKLSPNWKGTILVDHYQPLYTNTMGITSSAVVDVRSNQPFWILVANFIDQTIDLLPHQVVAAALSNQKTLVESQLSHAEVFGLMPHDMNFKFRKQHNYAHDIETISKHLADNQEKHIGEEEKPVTAADIYIDVLKDKEDNVRALLTKHERSWSGQLGEINVAEICTDMAPEMPSN